MGPFICQNRYHGDVNEGLTTEQLDRKPWLLHSDPVRVLRRPSVKHAQRRHMETTSIMLPYCSQDHSVPIWSLFHGARSNLQHNRLEVRCREGGLRERKKQKARTATGRCAADARTSVALTPGMAVPWACSADCPGLCGASTASRAPPSKLKSLRSSNFWIYLCSIKNIYITALMLTVFF